MRTGASNGTPFYGKTYNERGGWDYTHDRLRCARNTLNYLLSKQVMFTHMEHPEYTPTNNLIKGKVNAQLRCMLRNPQGMPLMHRKKAVFWWCYMHSPNRLPA